MKTRKFVTSYEVAEAYCGECGEGVVKAVRQGPSLEILE
jgi:transcription initiation factor TFIIIB Brf1 subunit/transcription initiation factor TFIIB